MLRSFAAALLLLLSVPVAADTSIPVPTERPVVSANPAPAEQPASAPPGTAPRASAATPDARRGRPEDESPWLFRVDPDAYSIINAGRGLSLHKPIYFFPVSWSNDYPGGESEFVFQVSAKVRLFGSRFFLGYSQKSFWQVYNSDDSRPFRETDYNPEIFYRWHPDPERWHRWGFDFGLEHESNGREAPASRSWNRAYISAYQPKGRQLLYVKAWLRIPEEDKRFEGDPEGDDNPDIEDYYGWAEVHYARQLGNRQLLSAMLRGNPATGRGAMSLTWSKPTADQSMFWAASLWHGYGESLVDYDNSVTRVMIGVMLTR